MVLGGDSFMDSGDVTTGASRSAENQAKYQAKYPLGQFSYSSEGSDLTSQEEKAKIQGAIEKIAKLPIEVRKVVSALSDKELNFSYREGGWNVSQVVHHLADSHLNSYVRFKLALTENTPTIRPYREDLWNELGDTTIASVPISLNLLEAIHEKWVLLLNSLGDSAWQRRFYHPEEKAEVALSHNVAFYAWHGEHHLAHINLALKLKQAKIGIA